MASRAVPPFEFRFQCTRRFFCLLRVQGHLCFMLQVHAHPFAAREPQTSIHGKKKKGSPADQAEVESCPNHEEFLAWSLGTRTTYQGPRRPVHSFLDTSYDPQSRSPLVKVQFFKVPGVSGIRIKDAGHWMFFQLPPATSLNALSSPGLAEEMHLAKIQIPNPSKFKGQV